VDSKVSVPGQKKPPSQFFHVKVHNHTVDKDRQSPSKNAMVLNFKITVQCPAGHWDIHKSYPEIEQFSQQIHMYYSKENSLHKFSHFEPIFFGSPDYSKAAQEVEAFLVRCTALPHFETLAPALEFLGYKYGCDSLNQMYKVRDYKNKHGMTLTHFSLGSGLELNYALFCRDSSLKGQDNVNMSVLEGWESKKVKIPKGINSEFLPKQTSSPEHTSDNNSQAENKKVPQTENMIGTTTNTPVTSGALIMKNSESESESSKKEKGGHLKVPVTQHPPQIVSDRASSGGSVENDKKHNHGSEHHHKHGHKGESEDPLKSPPSEAPDKEITVTRESMKERDRVSKILQKAPLGVFHHKHISKNIDCEVTCLATFKEADLVIMGMENGKIAAFKEVGDIASNNLELQLLSKLKVFKNEITRISLSPSKGVVYCVGDDNGIAVLDLASWKVVEKHTLPGKIGEFIYEPDYDVAIVAHGQNKITVLDLADPKKFHQQQIKVMNDASAQIFQIDMDIEAGMVFCSDDVSGTITVLDIDYPFAFGSAITPRCSAFGLSKCKDITFWEERKEVYCGFPGGLLTIHRLFGEADHQRLEFIATCRVSSANLNLVAHYDGCPYLFTSARDGCLSLWSPPDKWRAPFNTHPVQGKEKNEQTSDRNTIESSRKSF
jgi:hypothetical protein